MNPPPACFALAGNVGSTYSKTCSARAGMFERSGRTFAPAGMMWSVEMAIERADGGAAGRRGESHADTRSAGDLELADARLDKLRHEPACQHQEQRLARAGRDRDRDSRRDALVVECVRDDTQVPERGIHAAPDRDLRDLRARDLPDRLHVVGTGGARDEGLQLA